MITAVWAITCGSLDNTGVGSSLHILADYPGLANHWTHALHGVKHRSSGNGLGQMITGLRFSFLLSSHRWTHPTIYDRDGGVQVLWILCDRHSELDPPLMVSYLVCLHACQLVTMWQAPGAGSASPADDNSGVGNHLRIIGQHRHWLLTAYPSRLIRVSQPPDPCLAWGQTPQFRQWSRGDDSQPEVFCLTILSPLDTPNYL
jgi:hypothetical protein